MDWKVAWLAVALCSAGAGSAGLWAAAAQARGAPLIRNPVVLNIGFVCAGRSMHPQSAAGDASRANMSQIPSRDVANPCAPQRPRAAGPGRWIGFNPCVRTGASTAAPAAARRKRAARIRTVWQR